MKIDVNRNKHRLYDDLAWAWSLFGPAEEYAEEAGFFAKTIIQQAKIPVRTLLGLVCGAGGNDFTLKKHFQVTGVDLSTAMLVGIKPFERKNGEK